MTIQELANIYGVKTHITSKGEDLFSIAKVLYASYEDKYLSVLTELNSFPSWKELPAGTTVKYLHKDYVNFTQLW